MILKKKNFLLLEILIGLLLIELVAAPFLAQPIRSFQEELKSFEELEGERLADITFLELKEKLLQNAIPWESLPRPGEKKELFFPPIDLHLPHFPSKKIKRHLVVKCDSFREKIGKQGEIYRLLKVEVLFEPTLTKKRFANKKPVPYRYQLTVKQVSSSP